MMVIYLKEEKLEIKESKPMILPDGFKSILFGKSSLAKAARNYVKKRGFNLQKVAMAGWGYGTKGKYFGYLIIPFHQHGELVYFNARLFIGNGQNIIIQTLQNLVWGNPL